MSEEERLRLYNNIIDSYKDCIKNTGLNNELQPSLEIIYQNEIYTYNPDGTTEVKPLDKNEKINPQDLAYYNSENHVIRLFADNSLNRGQNEIKETLSHELYHAKEAVLRNSLPEADKKEIVKEVLIDNIKSGENIKIVKTYNGKDYTVMTSPVMSKKMAFQYADFAEKHLFNDDNTQLQKLTEYYNLKYNSNDSKKNMAKIKQLENELKPVLDDLDTILQNNKDYKQQSYSFFKFGANKKEQRKELLEYTIAVANRYNIYSEKDIHKEIPIVTNYNKKEVKDSISSNINAVDGNAALSEERKQISDKNFLQKLFSFRNLNDNDEFLQYYYSEEELSARKTGYAKKIEILEEQKKNVSFLEKFKINKQIKKIKKIIKLEQLSYENYCVKQKLRNNPNDVLLAVVCATTNTRVILNEQFAGKLIAKTVNGEKQSTLSNIKCVTDLPKLNRPIKA